MALQFKNYEAAARKPNMKDFGLFTQNRDLSWIAAEKGFIMSPVTGAQDSINRTFMSTALEPVLLLNGQVLELHRDYEMTQMRTFRLKIAPTSDDRLRELT